LLANQTVNLHHFEHDSQIASFVDNLHDHLGLKRNGKLKQNGLTRLGYLQVLAILVVDHSQQYAQENIHRDADKSNENNGVPFIVCIGWHPGWRRDNETKQLSSHLLHSHDIWKVC
jgi:hypothetical protein